MNTELLQSDRVASTIDGRFTLLQPLGNSEQGNVFLCEVDGDPSAMAAIKMIPANAEGVESHIDGWSAAAELSHPHLMRVLATGRSWFNDREIVYVVTEYAEEVLSEILPLRALTPSEAKDMLSPVVDALSYIHGNGLVHGDLKPSNIMVVNDQLKLSVDNLFDPSGPARSNPVPRDHDAPEWATGEVSPAVDVWSLGVTLVEALTQHLPAWSDELQIEPIVARSIPKPFSQIAEGCLKTDPAQRCTLGEIRACIESGTAIPKRSTGKPEIHSSPFRRVAMLVVASIFVLAVAVTLAIRSYQPTRHAQNAEKPPSPAIASAPTQAQVPQSSNQENVPSPSTEEPPPAATASSQSPASASPAIADNQPSSPTPAVASAPIPVSAPVQTQAPTPAPPPIQTARISNVPAGKGAVVQQVLPDVPAKASRTISGTVKVGIQVNVAPDGSVSEASIASQGPSQYFANLALKAAKSWKFSPQADGQSAVGAWTLQFSFKQAGVEATASEGTL